MQQIQLYEYLGISNDPIFNQIKGLQKKESMKVQLVDTKLVVTLNQWGIFEVSNVEFHESFSELQECYDFINEIISESQIENGAFI